jgi:hypothetical protein
MKSQRRLAARRPSCRSACELSIDLCFHLGDDLPDAQFEKAGVLDLELFDQCELTI